MCKLSALIARSADFYGPQAINTFIEPMVVSKLKEGKKANYNVLGKGMMRIAAPFNAIARESIEMIYQYYSPYLFDSSKFEDRFFKATSYDEGLKLIAEDKR